MAADLELHTFDLDPAADGDTAGVLGEQRACSRAG